MWLDNQKGDDVLTQMEKNNEHQKDCHHTLRCFYCLRKAMAQIYPRDSSREICILHIRDPCNHTPSCLSVSGYTVAKGTSLQNQTCFWSKLI